MQFFRAFGGGLLWIVASLIGLVAGILCVTVILLPLGIPLLGLARRLFGQATTMMLPRSLSHPVEETKRSWRKKRRKAKGTGPDVGRVAEKGKKPRQGHEAGCQGQEASGQEDEAPQGPLRLTGGGWTGWVGPGQ